MDGLRAVAILLVFIAHFCPSDLNGAILNRVVRRGGFGVEVFFVISGFLITYLLLVEEHVRSRIVVRLFYGRRAVRILPALVVYLTVLFVADHAGIIIVPIRDLLASLLFARNYVGTSWETGHLWTLAIEEQFYVVWPLFLVILRTPQRRITVMVALICLSPIWRQVSYRLVGGAAAVNAWRTDLRSEPLAIGALLALLLSVTRTRNVLIRSSIWTAGAASVILICVQLTGMFERPVLRAFVPTLSWISVAAIINFSIQNSRSILTSLLEWRPLVGIGRLSYSLYLWQQPFAPHLPGMTAGRLREFPINLLLAVGFALCSYYFVEQPFARLRHRLRGQPQNPSATATTFNGLAVASGAGRIRGKVVG